MKPAHMAAMLLTTLLILYPLSLGPVARYYSRRPSMGPPPQQVLTFYAPLFWLCRHSRSIDQAYIWYFKMWEA